MNSSGSISPKLNSILVTGDVTIDNYIYEGEKYSSRADKKRPVQSVTELGGSLLIYKILNELHRNIQPAKPDDSQITWNVFHASSLLNIESALSFQSSYSSWKPFPGRDSKQNFWRMSKALGYGRDLNTKEISALIEKEKLISPPKTAPEILVIQDSGFCFRKKQYEEFWNLSDQIHWIVLKLTSPVAYSELWYELIEKYSQKLLAIVSADELRTDGAKIGKGFSWEQTIEETLESIYTLPQFQKLTACRHLLINFSMDGAIWISNQDKKNRRTTLIYDPSRGEGEFEHGFQGKAFGYMSCFTAGIIYELIKKYSAENSYLIDLPAGIQTGLSAMRNLIEQGHGPQDDIFPGGFPAGRISGQISNPKHSFSRVYIPFTKQIEKDIKEKWMIVELTQHVESSARKISLYGLASQIIFKGAKALSNIPHARFGKLITADRQEIETLRRLRLYMIDYNENKKNNCPISFGIFGAPGAGKSFGVKQIANEIFGSKSWLEFNLSQFNSISELNGAFHQIRDSVLSGLTAVAFWDEFDSKNYFWLQYFLAPMQSGNFQEGALTHTIGKCIFIFAGATSHTYESFGEFKNDVEREQEFVLMKGPDFKSRLDSYYNVLGPNQRIINSETGQLDSSDITLYLRRAIFISTKLNYSSYLPAEIDHNLINALLRISKYKHGARSLDKLLTLLQSEDHTCLNQSLLPSKHQLAMYVDSDEFEKLMQEGQVIFKELPVEELAEAIHESFRENCTEKGEKIKDKFNKPFNELTEAIKEDNRAAARRMHEILALVGLYIVKKEKSAQLEKDQDINIMNHLEYHMELLSEAEHNGWMKQRLNAGWKYGEIRDDEKKIHPDLIPYHKLSNKEKEKDRESIRGYNQKLKSAGYIIDWM
jgi:hypothetical protein